MKHSSIFKNRWFAILWAAGIVWMALDVAGTGGDGANANEANASGITDATGASVDNQQLEQIGAALNAL